MLLAPLLVIAAFAGYLALTFGLALFQRVPYASLLVAASGVALGIWRAAQRPGAGTLAAAVASVALAGFGAWWIFGYSMYGPREEQPGVGDRFPDFTLPDSTGATFELASARGRPIVLLFYRGDW